MMMRVEQHFQH